MENGKQPINPTTYTRVGDGDNDFEPLVDGHRTGYERQFGGLTKREYFAALAMQGLCANSIAGSHHIPEKLVADAICFADELLKQLEKPTK